MIIDYKKAMDDLLQLPIKRFYDPKGYCTLEQDGEGDDFIENHFFAIENALTLFNYWIEGAVVIREGHNIKINHLSWLKDMWDAKRDTHAND